MSTSTVRTESETRTIERVRGEILDGASYARGHWIHLENERCGQRHGYVGPITHTQWAQIMSSLAAFASTSRFCADVANRIIGKINLYGTAYQVMSAVDLALSAIIKDGWFDTVAATGPEPGRPSSHQHALTERQCVLLALLERELSAAVSVSMGSLPGVGWCLQAIAEEHDLFPVPGYLFPALHAHYAKAGRA